MNWAKKGSSKSAKPNPSPSCASEPPALPSTLPDAPSANVELQRIIEAILFAAKRPLTCKQVQEVFPELEQPDLADIQAALDGLVEAYQPRGIALVKVASGYRFQVRSDLSRWVARLFEEKPPKYSKALLETLAIIAYRQPVTRGDIEDIRGVSVSSNMIQTLQEREWIRVLGYKEAPGRPALYGTTKLFLDYFNLSTLNELPTLQALQELDLPPITENSKERA
nr:SMC-Scp complex subunit ScpB [Methylovulum psychrotolerans]